jgi:hypothetical protein
MVSDWLESSCSANCVEGCGKPCLGFCEMREMRKWKNALPSQRKANRNHCLDSLKKIVNSPSFSSLICVCKKHWIDKTIGTNYLQMTLDDWRKDQGGITQEIAIKTFLT